ncbi:MAG: hypothetical protein ACOCXA_02930 [Planctomycetota bacterium]
MNDLQWETMTWTALALGAATLIVIVLYLLHSLGRLLRLQWAGWEQTRQHRLLASHQNRRQALAAQHAVEIEQIEHRIRRRNLEDQVLSTNLQAQAQQARQHAEIMYSDLKQLHLSHKKLRNENHDLRGQLHVLTHELNHVLNGVAEHCGLTLDSPIIPPLPPRVEIPSLITVGDDEGQKRLAEELQQFVRQSNELAEEKAHLEYRNHKLAQEIETLRAEVDRLLHMNDARMQELHQNAEHLAMYRKEQERVQQEICQKEEELRQVRMGGEMAQAAVEDMQRRIGELYSKNQALNDQIKHTSEQAAHLKALQAEHIPIAQTVTADVALLEQSEADKQTSEEGERASEDRRQAHTQLVGDTTPAADEHDGFRYDSCHEEDLDDDPLFAPDQEDDAVQSDAAQAGWSTHSDLRPPPI